MVTARAANFLAGWTPRALAACALHFDDRDVVVFRMYFTGGAEHDDTIVDHVIGALNEEFCDGFNALFEAYPYRGVDALVPGGHLCFLRWEPWPHGCYHAVSRSRQAHACAVDGDWQLVEHAGEYLHPYTRELIPTHRAVAGALPGCTCVIPADPHDFTMDGGIPLAPTVKALLGAVTHNMRAVACYGDVGVVGVVAVFAKDITREDELALACVKGSLLADFVGVDVRISTVARVPESEMFDHGPEDATLVYGRLRDWDSSSRFQIFLRKMGQAARGIFSRGAN
jgi:hypothetical protein